ncbi:glycosyltransferase [Psychroflexus sp. CAK8W]|uniref:Glycosyltransferase n=1 Tax=Psychroflexus longus TaxID=2873596 RepID=A0ABS7XLR6_9FLAO|nr:glycosyltransferase [Psychroflexus longus]MBZ9779439.1 glycosyltransferase [Psychroflexus longus]
MANQIESLQLQLGFDIAHVSYLITSVQEFCLKHNVKLNYVKEANDNRGCVKLKDNRLYETLQIPKKIAFINLKLKSGKSICLVFDFDDSYSFFSLKGLYKSDYYFKRTYVQNNINLIQIEFNTKICPLGISFMVKPDSIKYYRKLKSCFYWNRLRSALKLDRNLFGRFQIGIENAKEDWNSFISTRTLSDFENFETPKHFKSVFYQKRFFPNEKTIETRTVHSQRAELVRLLKKEFPNQFKGGIKDDENLPLKYKDCASSIKGSQKEFLEITKESGICIYTRGLSNSVGWTLSEFLSQGKAIIAERQDVVFPKALKHNVHLLYFDSTEELKSQVQYLIDNPSEVKRLSKNARQYYEENISPKIYFETLLKQIHV